MKDWTNEKLFLTVLLFASSFAVQPQASAAPGDNHYLVTNLLRTGGQKVTFRSIEDANANISSTEQVYIQQSENGTNQLYFAGRIRQIFLPIDQSVLESDRDGTRIPSWFVTAIGGNYLRPRVSSNLRDEKFSGFSTNDHVYLIETHCGIFQIPKPDVEEIEDINATSYHDRGFSVVSMKSVSGQAVTYAIRHRDGALMGLRNYFDKFVNTDTINLTDVNIGHLSPFPQLPGTHILKSEAELKAEAARAAQSTGVNFSARTTLTLPGGTSSASALSAGSAAALSTGGAQTPAAPLSPAERLTQAARYIEKSNVSVLESGGGNKSAWEIVKGFGTILNTDAAVLSITADNEVDASIREKIEQIYRNLIKREIGSVKILGPAGSGKTTLVKQAIAEIAKGHAPEILQNTVFIQVDGSALSSGTKYVGAMESKVAAMLALSRKFNIVWIVDETHSFRGMGTSEKDDNDVLQLLKPGLTEGYLRMIGMDTDNEWNHAFQTDPALDQRFALVRTSEPTAAELVQRLRSFAKKHSFPAIGDSELALIIRLSTEFNATGAQPRNSTLLIEEIFAEQQLRGAMHSPTQSEVKASAQRLYNLNQNHFDTEAQRNLVRNLPSVLDAKVIGQAAAKQSIISAAEQTATNLEDKSKPKGRLIFAGPAGQGKTELASAMGEGLDRPVERIVMTTYQSPLQTVELKKRIAEALQKNPLTILFFDEIEKANLQVQNDLLDLLDSGEFVYQPERSSTSVVINVRNAWVIFATNAGLGYLSREAREAQNYNQGAMVASMKQDGLSPYLIDRSPGVVPFFYLSRGEYRAVVALHAQKVLNDVKRNRPDLKVTFANLQGFIDQVVADTYHDEMSNREALNSTSGEMRSRLAKVILSGPVDAKTARVDLPGKRASEQPALATQAPTVREQPKIGFHLPPIAPASPVAQKGGAGINPRALICKNLF